MWNPFRKAARVIDLDEKRRQKHEKNQFKTILEIRKIKESHQLAILYLDSVKDLLPNSYERDLYLKKLETIADTQMAKKMAKIVDGVDR